MKKQSIKYEDFKAELLKDPQVREEYEALIPRFKLVRDFILRRNQLNISQFKLAKLIGTQQPAISRFERGDGNTTIETLHKIAAALDMDLNITLNERSRTKTIV